MQVSRDKPALYKELRMRRAFPSLTLSKSLTTKPSQIILSGTRKGGEFPGLTVYLLGPTEAIEFSGCSACAPHVVDIRDRAVDEIETAFTLRCGT